MKSKRHKYFTVEQANSMLPLIRAIVSDLVALWHDVSERKRRLESLAEGRTFRSPDVYSEEVEFVEQQLERDVERLRAYLDELRELGVEPQGFDGVIEFPTMMDGRLAYLSWKFGEPQISYWHDAEGNSPGRLPLPAATETVTSL
ncbi:MAG: DUF2203 domain-containing protein [Pirellulaceae bacterium]